METYDSHPPYVEFEIWKENPRQCLNEPFQIGISYTSGSKEQSAD